MIAELTTRQARLSRYIDELLEDDHPDPGEVARVMQLYGRTASRLGFLVAYRQAFGRATDRVEARVRMGASEPSDDEGV